MTGFAVSGPHIFNCTACGSRPASVSAVALQRSGKCIPASNKGRIGSPERAAVL